MLPELRVNRECSFSTAAGNILFDYNFVKREHFLNIINCKYRSSCQTLGNFPTEVQLQGRDFDSGLNAQRLHLTQLTPFESYIKYNIF